MRLLTDDSLLRIAKALETIVTMLQQAIADDQTWKAELA